MAPNLFQTVHAMVLPRPGRPIIDIENHQRRHGRHHSPAHNPVPISVNDKPHAGKSRPGRHIAQISNPQPLRCRRNELAFHQIPRADFGDRGAVNLAPGRPAQAAIAAIAPTDAADGLISSQQCRRLDVQTICPQQINGASGAPGPLSWVQIDSTPQRGYSLLNH